MKSKEIIYDSIISEIVKLQLDDYHTLFLANLILRRIRHPEEHMKERVTKVMKKMTVVYQKKKNVIEISSEKCLDILEEKLEECPNIPDHLYSGRTVGNVVKFYTSKVMESLEE